MGWQSFFPKVLLCEFLLSLLLKLRMRHVTLGWERANAAFPGVSAAASHWAARLVTRHFPLGSAPSQPSSLALHPASGTGTEPTLPLYPPHPPRGSPLAPRPPPQPRGPWHRPRLRLQRRLRLRGPGPGSGRGRNPGFLFVTCVFPSPRHSSGLLLGSRADSVLRQWCGLPGGRMGLDSGVSR